MTPEQIRDTAQKVAASAIDAIDLFDCGEQAPDDATDDELDEIHRLVQAAVVTIADDAGLHVIEFREDGFTVQHPLTCRPNLFACPANRAAERMHEPPAAGPGRYACSLGDDGELVIGERVTIQ